MHEDGQTDMHDLPVMRSSYAFCSKIEYNGIKSSVEIPSLL
jgi:hypothetical protein